MNLCGLRLGLRHSCQTRINKLVERKCQFGRCVWITVHICWGDPQLMNQGFVIKDWDINTDISWSCAWERPNQSWWDLQPSNLPSIHPIHPIHKYQGPKIRWCYDPKNSKISSNPFQSPSGFWGSVPPGRDGHHIVTAAAELGALGAQHLQSLAGRGLHHRIGLRDGMK